MGFLQLGCWRLSTSKHFILLTSISSSYIPPVPPLIKQMHYIFSISNKCPSSPQKCLLQVFVGGFLLWKTSISSLRDANVGFEKTNIEASQKVISRKQSGGKESWTSQLLGVWGHSRSAGHFLQGAHYCRRQSPHCGSLCSTLSRRMLCDDGHGPWYRAVLCLLLDT